MSLFERVAANWAEGGPWAADALQRYGTLWLGPVCQTVDWAATWGIGNRQRLATCRGRRLLGGRSSRVNAWIRLGRSADGIRHPASSGAPSKPPAGRRQTGSRWLSAHCWHGRRRRSCGWQRDEHLPWRISPSRRCSYCWASTWRCSHWRGGQSRTNTSPQEQSNRGVRAKRGDPKTS